MAGYTRARGDSGSQASDRYKVGRLSFAAAMLIVGVCAVGNDVLCDSTVDEPSSNTRPRPELYVRSGDPAQYPTIQAALDAAPPGAVVHVAAGTYEEPVKITKPVVLRGAGWKNTIISQRSFLFRNLDDETQVPPESRARLAELIGKAKEAKNGDDQNRVLKVIYEEFGWKQPLTVENAQHVRVSGFRLTMPGAVEAGGWQNAPAVLIDTAQLRLVDCAVAGSPAEGIEVRGDADVDIRDTLIAGVRSTGVEVNANATAHVRLSKCEIRHCGYSGVCVKGAGQVDIDGCRITDTEYHGIRYDDASPNVIGNIIARIHRAGIYADGESHATIRDNVFVDCGYGGRGGHDLIAYNTFVFRSKPSGPLRPELAAIWLDAVPHPVVRRNVVTGYEHVLGINAGRIDGRLMDHNVFQVTKSPVVRRPVLDPSGIEEEATPPDNESQAIKFRDAEQGDFRLPDTKEWQERDVGARRFAPLCSPWPELPEERRLVDALAKAEAEKK